MYCELWDPNYTGMCLSKPRPISSVVHRCSEVSLISKINANVIDHNLCCNFFNCLFNVDKKNTVLCMLLAKIDTFMLNLGNSKEFTLCFFVVWHILCAAVYVCIMFEKQKETST